VSADKPRFTIRASGSRLGKGLLAIPQRFNSWFPKEKQQIQVVFDDEARIRAFTFHPYDSTVKETRIFGLRQWFSRRNVQEGDAISITVEDPHRHLYRITLDRYVQQQQESRTREQLQSSRTDADAEREFTALSRLTKRRPQDLAHRELLRIAQASGRQPRPTVLVAAAARHDDVPSGIRVLLREVHEGRCQLCSFTFEKRNGEPYFEIHHLEPKIGHSPNNLSVVCANCHAQLEHARITDFKWSGRWLVRLAINGKLVVVRQPFAHDPIRRALLGFAIVFALARARRLLSRL
jgi:hypothetical protein